MPVYNGHRLRNHPQAFKRVEQVWKYVFTCPACETTKPLGRAQVNAGGTLICKTCAYRHSDYGHSDYDHIWCSTCKRALPPTSFSIFGNMEVELRCNDCRNPVRNRTCQHCGQSFNAKRDDARYCSTRCRVAAHRRLTESIR